MNHNSDRGRMLADYIFDDVGPEELVEIEREISEDPELSELFRMNMKVKEYLKARIQLEEMRSDPGLTEAEKLAEFAFDQESRRQEPPGKDTPDPKPRVKTGFTRRGLMFAAATAAAVALLITVRVLLPVTNADRLYRGYYEPLDASDYSQRGATSAVYQDLSEGINNYNRENYEESSRIFERIGSLNPDQPEVKFFSGLSYLGLEQYHKAKVILEEYIDNNSRYLPEAIWYLSLCCLKTGDIEESGELLIRLGAWEGMYEKDAQALWRKLRRIR